MKTPEHAYVECHRCEMVFCKEPKSSYNTKNIYGRDGSVKTDFPEPVLECEVLRGAMSEEQMLLLLRWFQLREALLEPAP
jgi:hypothetical protein